jgi:hypothetical protein
MVLAALAGRTAVAGAATGAWLGHGAPKKEEQLAVQRLEATSSSLRRTWSRAATAQEALWTTRLADLLEEDQDAEAGLRSRMREVQAALPAGVMYAADQMVAARRDVNITADCGGVAAGVVHGNVGPPNPPGQGPAAS